MVEEYAICCGDFFTFGGGLGLLHEFDMSVVGMGTWVLIVVHPNSHNICVLITFLPSWLCLDQHRYLSFVCGALGC